MDLLFIVLVVALLCVLDVAALRWGADSRHRTERDVCPRRSL